MSEFVNSMDVAGEILRLATLACATGENPVATPSDFKHVLVGNRIPLTETAGGDVVLTFGVPAQSMWVVTWIFVRSIPTPALTAGVFNPLGGDWRSNQDITPNNSFVAGQTAPFVAITVNGTPSTAGGASGIMPQLLFNRPLLLTFRSDERVAIKVGKNGPAAAPGIDLVIVAHGYLCPVSIGQCLSKMSTAIASPPAGIGGGY
jgi:hypothetical protein